MIGPDRIPLISILLDDDGAERLNKMWNSSATPSLKRRLPLAQMNYTMERTSMASRSNLILTSGIISAVLSATLFCVAYLVL